MRRAAYLVLLCVGLVFAQSRTAPSTFTPTVGAPELHVEGDNLTDIQRKLYDYAQSGQYDREITQVTKAAHDWVETRAGSAAPNEKLAAIFDIDETLLSNLPNMLNCGFCSGGAQGKLFQGVRIPAIPEVRDLYSFAKSRGITVIVLTGRYESGRDATIHDLQDAGYSGWEELLMRPNADSDPARIMKAGVRQDVEKKGYKIILNIGDQLSDLIGGHSERTYKLPNPFYFVE